MDVARTTLSARDPLDYLRAFFPPFFDPDSPLHVAPELIDIALDMATDARPRCLSERQQNFAQAMFAAYLIGVQREQAAGTAGGARNSGVVLSEREGDIAVTYANPDAVQGGVSQAPSSDPWDQWYRLWRLCGKGMITTRFGDRAWRMSSTRIMGYGGSLLT